jgi:hypothetical protein
MLLSFQKKGVTDLDIQYRNELKHRISYSDVVTLRHRLRAVMKPDEHAGADGSYHVRSLYFDTPENKALREKIDGVNIREKFRIRYYNGDTSFIQLEKKSKRNGYGHKQYALLSAAEAQSIVDGNLDWMPSSGRPLIIELYSKMKVQGLQPKTIVDYTREAFVFNPGNVRVTLDYDIRTGLSGTDFLNPDCVTIPAGDSATILEVKWDEFLPSSIRKAVQLRDRRSAAFSKYQVCRIYG